MPVAFVCPNFRARTIYDDQINITQPPVHSPTIAGEMYDGQVYNGLPANYDDLSPEEQEVVKARLRFMGMRCRADYEESVKITRETLDIP
jgi:hypothetical protein